MLDGLDGCGVRRDGVDGEGFGEASRRDGEGVGDGGYLVVKGCGLIC